MKNSLVLLLVLILGNLCNSSAQEKFIEVMVKDTIALKPISYEFEVLSDSKFNYDYDNPNGASEYAEKLRASESKIVNLLKEYSYEFSLSGNPDANITLESTDKKIYTVKVEDSLEKELFKTRMKKEGVNFYISNIDYEDRDTEAKTKEIYIKLMKRAKERAELIAELNHMKVGEIVEISESKSDFSFISSFIENFAYSRSSIGSSTSYSFNPSVIEKSIVVKYAVK
ncbi:SIMPL domain-containing protein [Zobellia roscoffensis]|uniref:SIMPL domain-containing protein n=1 Tax=Zobellia roscoffensis TaxID=2779508 RepID=UPI00188CB615|nr:SIMPL domain-containing protein [Zobellia roscoffensis]